MATISCPNCNAQLDESKKFCTECGKKLPVMEEQQPDEIALQATQKFSIQEDKNLEEAVKAVFQKDDEAEEETTRKKSRKQKKQKKLEEKENKEQQTKVDFSALAGSALDDSPYEPISAWGFIGILALFAIPVIGWIFAIIWACGGCRKLNKRNLARGYLIILALIAVFAACAFLAFWKIAPAYLENSEPVSVVTEDPIYTVEGTNPSNEEEAPEFEEGENSLITYLRDVGDQIWNAYYDRSLPGGDELTAILDEDRDALLNLGYSENSVDQVLNMVNGDFEALSSLLNLIEGQATEAPAEAEEVIE